MTDEKRTKNETPREDVVREAVLGTARTVEEKKNSDGTFTLSTGARVKMRPVSASVVQEAQMRIPDPEVPTWYNENKGREEENPHDPGYKARLRRAKLERNAAALDVMIVMGAELVEAVPDRPFDSDGWLRRLKLAKTVDRDPEDELEREYWYLKYVAFGAGDLGILQNAVVSEEGIQRAIGTFQRNEE